MTAVVNCHRVRFSAVHYYRAQHDSSISDSCDNAEYFAKLVDRLRRRNREKNVYCTYIYMNTKNRTNFWRQFLRAPCQNFASVDRATSVVPFVNSADTRPFVRCVTSDIRIFPVKRLLRLGETQTTPLHTTIQSQLFSYGPIKGVCKHDASLCRSWDMNSTCNVLTHGRRTIRNSRWKSIDFFIVRTMPVNRKYWRRAEEFQFVLIYRCRSLTTYLAKVD